MQMASLKFPGVTKFAPEFQNVNELVDRQMTLGERAADRIATMVGSWRFIIIQSIILTIWALVNGIGWSLAWDPYPFILMNLVLSTQAAFAAPIIMMSQNRQGAMDRIEAHNDYAVNLRAEEQIQVILKNLDAQNEALLEIYRLLNERNTMSSSEGNP
jgi:uncharacterized membrane protein